MEKNPVLYRKRLIPSECILLKDDVILSTTDNVILTKWNALKPKKELHHGYSCYYLKEGIKVSKFLKEDGSLIYWYCDIVDYEYDADTNTLVSIDLLLDVLIYPDGFVKVLDMDELVTARKDGSLSDEQLDRCLLIGNALLEKIYKKEFDELIAPMLSLH